MIVMAVTIISTENDLKKYTKWVTSHPNGSLWQSLDWKKYQEFLGREVRIYIEEEDEEIVESALVVIDKTMGGFSTWDIPRGPLGPMNNGQWKMDNLIKIILSDAKNDRCISLYFSPIKKPIINYQLSIINSDRHEQPQATRIIDLTQSEEEILAQMHQKGRYNIKVAQKNGVFIEDSHDIENFFELVQETGLRDHFTHLPKRHYKNFLEHIDNSFLLMAYDDQKTPISGVLGASWNNMGIYYYGASLYAHRAKMAPYLLQWKAMKRCKDMKCTSYDLFGIAPPNSSPDHSWAGVSSFKEKFGGTVVEYPTEQAIVLKPLMKKLLRMKRKILW
jgi:peptidoglycan pentaglycine glycine transferase (the first glycine)